ncbi:hypothetical protein DID88_002684 [Monilinia fructigena]|uniref:Uncharacterized protein n=1 Tax=Monilinia fructigena TaxID=38457 RepID=A0A395IPI4_9HELO|nr:hypothetical protein DID88_002684 [Monilinia fructigena]
MATYSHWWYYARSCKLMMRVQVLMSSILLLRLPMPPASLTFGSNFMKLANTYAGTVVLGLNRGLNDITNYHCSSKIRKSNLAPLGTDGKAANAVGKEYVLGETNSVAGGGASSVSPTFGAAIWTLDYALQATTLNITTIYYHHGTVGKCYYCWWGRYNAGGPYYGAWLAANSLCRIKATSNKSTPAVPTTPSTSCTIVYEGKEVNGCECVEQGG